MSHRILIVEDDLQILEILQDMLELDGLQVISASNGKDALDLIEEEEFELVVTDLRMPVVSGGEIARRVKLKNRAIPVILMTGNDDQIEEKDLTEKQIDLVLAKPFSWDALREAVSGVLAKAA